MLVVFPVYKRLDALQHFKRYYDDPKFAGFMIYISLEGDSSEVIRNYVDNLKFDFLKWKVRSFDSRQGLRSHILQCGDLVEDYERVLIVEDDLLLLPGWDTWYRLALRRLASNDLLDSASMYRYSIDEENSIPLDLVSGDEYSSQYGSSWGQIWTRQNWNRFKIWLKENEQSYYPTLPKFINNWSISSWKKHYLAYLIDVGLYCLYPPESLICHTKITTGTNLVSNAYFRTYHAGGETALRDVESSAYYDVNWTRIFEVAVNEKVFKARYNNGLDNNITSSQNYKLAMGYCRNSIAQWETLVYPLHHNISRIPDNKSKWGLHLVKSKDTVLFSKQYIFQIYYLDRVTTKATFTLIGLLFLKVFKRLFVR